MTTELTERWLELREYCRLRKLAADYLKEHPSVKTLLNELKSVDTEGTFAWPMRSKEAAGGMETSSEAL